jgi:hypothetical protein
MNNILLAITFTLITLSSNAQNEKKNVIIDSTCSCIGNAIDSEENTKFDFEYNFDNCMERLVLSLSKLDSKYEDPKEINTFIHSDLKEGCSRYHEVDSLKRLYSTHTFDVIASPEDCSIMKSGVFMSYGDKDSLRITMNKKEQIIKYPDGTYTKSKIKWLSDCSYQVIRKESTNAEDAQIKAGHKMTIKIIYVKDERIIFYEMLLNNKAYSGRMIKLEG